MAIPRSEILKKLYAQAEAGIPIIGGGAGTGISAKCEESGGIDLIVIYNTGRYRMAGRVSITGLFAYGDANAIVMEMAGEVLPVVKHTPVLAGGNATDPFRLMPHFLKQVKEVGFSGVQNFPTVGLFDGVMRANMEATGLGYDKEVEMIRLPHEVAATREQPIATTLRIAEAARKIRKDILVICPGGPFDEPENVAKAMARMPGINGFYGATSMEGLPVERAITAQVKLFKAMELGTQAGSL